jgi:hypothetical protein
VTAFGDELYARLSVMDGPSDDLSAYCDAIGAMFAEVEGYARGDETGDVLPWQALLDPAIAGSQALLWLAQLAGVAVPVGMTDETALRSTIEAANGRRRGTPAYMAEQGQATLTGTKTLRMFERYTGDAYLLHVVTRTDETPDPAATEAALRSVKPAGIVLTFEVSDGVTWDEPVHAWNAAGSTTWSESVTTVP